MIDSNTVMRSGTCTVLVACIFLSACELDAKSAEFPFVLNPPAESSFRVVASVQGRLRITSATIYVNVDEIAIRDRFDCYAGCPAISDIRFMIAEESGRAWSGVSESAPYRIDRAVPPKDEIKLNNLNFEIPNTGTVGAWLTLTITSGPQGRYRSYIHSERNVFRRDADGRLAAYLPSAPMMIIVAMFLALTLVAVIVARAWQKASMRLQQRHPEVWSKIQGHARPGEGSNPVLNQFLKDRDYERLHDPELSAQMERLRTSLRWSIYIVLAGVLAYAWLTFLRV